MITPTTRIPLIGLAGQSNVLKRCDTLDTGGPEFDFSFAGSTWHRDNRLSSGTIEDLSSGFDVMSPVGRKFGIERPLRERLAGHYVTVAEGATKLDRDWLVTQYMHTRLLARYDAALAAAGRSTFDLFVWFQGNNDANEQAAAEAYQANLGTFITALRARYGAFKLVVVYHHASSTEPFTATVRAQQEAYVASDANSRGVNPDAYPLDGVHYFTAGYVGLGRDVHATIRTANWHLTVGA